MKIIGFLSKKLKKQKIKLECKKQYQPENKKVNMFRNVFANIIIVCVLIATFSLTYVGGTLKAFSANEPTAIYNGNLNSNKISLMINVYWGNEFIEPMLNTLSSNNVKTTFFLGGIWVEKYSELAKKIVESGHELASHGYFHKDHSIMNLDANKKEILSCHELIKNKFNIEMNLFAPPSGAFNVNTIKAADALGYKTIMWTKDTIDWRDQDSELIENRALKNAKGGDLILMHPTKATSQALDKIIKELKAKNFVLTTVSSCLE